MVPFENEYLFGNTFLEAIPHPQNFLGTTLNLITLICHYMGGITFFVFSLPIVYLFYSRKFGSLLAYALFSTGIVNGLLKFFFESPRPMGLSEQFIEISTLVQEHSFGFPSGHAHVSVLIWGLVFFEFKNILIRAISIFFVVATPISRMYAGVHYLGDVVFGLLCGLIFLILFKKYKTFFYDFPDPKYQPYFLLHSRSINLTVLLLSLLPLFLDTSSNLTDEHVSSLSQVISASASLGGFVIANILIKLKFEHIPEKIGWEAPWIVISILILCIIFLYFGLGSISKNFFKDHLLLKFIRYFLLIFVITYLIPFIILIKKYKE